MKVGYVLNIFPKITETFILNEILAMQKKGVAIEVFAYKDAKEDHVHAQARQVPVRYFFKAGAIQKFSAHLYWIRRNFLRYLKAWVWVARHGDGVRKLFVWDLMDTVIVDKSRPDHLHAHFGDEASNTAMLVHLLSGVPFTFTTHSYDIFDGKYNNWKIKSALAKKHVTISEYNKNYIMDRYGVNPRHIAVVHCGVDFERIRLRAKESRKDLVVAIARLCPEKGLDGLVRACAKLKEQGVRFECRIAGEGPERPALEKQIRSLDLGREVILLGNQTQDEIFHLLDEATIKVLPSRSLETMGVALMEAMAIGVAVVGPRLNGCPELVEDGECGFLVNPDDVETLTDRMRQLLVDEALRGRFRESGYRKVFREFNLESETDKLLSIWKTPEAPAA